MPMPTTPETLSPDFSLLQQTASGQGQRSRRALWWMLGLLMLVLASVLGLVLYLDAFESAEEDRRRVTEGQWLEQNVHFHFRRLEDDLVVLARHAALQSASTGPEPQPMLSGGLLWNEPGAVLWHGWQPQAGASDADPMPPRWRTDQATHPANADMLSSMLDITTGLRRSSYAGPMRRADGTTSDVVWLAVPFFERGQFMGNYLASLSMDTSVQGLVPTWFRQNHVIRLVSDSADSGTGVIDNTGPYLAPMNLPGTDMFMEMTAREPQPALVPRIFLLVALVFLAGMLVSLLALRRDIGKRQRVQALLQDQMALRRAMESSVTIGLRAWARDGQILYVNDAFCRMVGYSAAELVGHTAPLPYWPPEHSDELAHVHRSIIAHGTPNQGAELQFQHRNGTRVDVLIHEAPLSGANGEQIGWMSSVLDISDRKRAQRLAAKQQKRLEASGRMVAVGEVASTLAHELNQPLGALSSFANGLLNRLRSSSIAPDEIERVVQRMAGLSDKAGGIIRRVNAFARQRELTRQALDLDTFVGRCVASQTALAGVSLQVLPTRARPWVQADELLLEHLVGNLVANAMDWATRGPAPPAQVQVWVDIDAARQLATICVADNGPGVRDDEHEHIFSAFFSTKDGGMGMGLAICRSIVEAHHGHIEVSRDSNLGGARFTVLLPLADRPHNQEQEKEP